VVIGGVGGWYLVVVTSVQYKTTFLPPPAKPFVKARMAWGVQETLRA